MGSMAFWMLIVATLSTLGCNETEFSQVNNRTGKPALISEDATSADPDVERFGGGVDPNSELTGVAIDPESRSTAKGGTAAYRAFASFASGQTRDVTAEAAWSVDTEFATLRSQDQNAALFEGLATTDEQGVEVQASYRGKVGTARLKVLSAKDLELKIDPPFKELAVDETFRFKAMLSSSDDAVETSDVSGLVTWTISDSQKASIDEKGEVHSLMPGSGIKVKARHEALGLTAEAELVIVGKVPTALKIAPASVKIMVNGQASFDATVVYSDNSEEIVTAMAAWTSATPAKVEPVASTPGRFNGKQATGAEGVRISASYTGAGVTVTGDASVVVEIPAMLTAELKVNNSSSDLTVAYNTPLEVSWSSQDASDGCTVAPFNYTGTSGTKTTPGQTATVTVTLTCRRGSETQTDAIRVTVLPPPAALSITANGSAATINVAYQGAATIAWTFRNATNCSVTDVGAVTADGSRAFNNLVTSKTYTLSCLNLVGQAVSKSVTVNVAARPPAPSVALKANGADAYLYVVPQTNVTLSYQIANATSCELQSSLFAGGKVGIAPASGTYGLGQLGDDRAFHLVCYNSVGDVSSSAVQINVQKVYMTANNVGDHLYIGRGSQFTLRYAAQHVTSCQHSTTDDSGNPLIESVPLNFPESVKSTGYWTKGHEFKCSVDAPGHGGVVTSSHVLAVHAVGVEMWLNGTPGGINVAPNGVVTVSYLGREVQSCQLFDTAPGNPLGRPLGLTSADTVNGAVQLAIDQTRGLFFKCSSHGVAVEVALPVFVVSVPPPHLVSAVTVGVSKSEAAGDLDKMSRFDDDWQICLGGNGVLSVQNLVGQRQVTKVFHVNFHIFYLDGQKAVQTVTAGPLNLQPTVQLGQPYEWGGVSGVGPVVVGSVGRVSGGSQFPLFRNSIQNPAIPKHCLKMSDSDMDASGQAWFTANFNIAR